MTGHAASQGCAIVLTLNRPVSRPSRSLRTRRAGRLELGGRPRLYICSSSTAIYPLLSGLDATPRHISRSLSLSLSLADQHRTTVPGGYLCPAAAAISQTFWAVRYRRSSSNWTKAVVRRTRRLAVDKAPAATGCGGAPAGLAARPVAASGLAPLSSVLQGRMAIGRR